jgi:hypothetical protein
MDGESTLLPVTILDGIATVTDGTHAIRVSARVLATHIVEWVKGMDSALQESKGNKDAALRLLQDKGTVAVTIAALRRSVKYDPVTHVIPTGNESVAGTPLVCSVGQTANKRVGVVATTPLGFVLSARAPVDFSMFITEPPPTVTKDAINALRHTGKAPGEKFLVDNLGLAHNDSSTLQDVVVFVKRVQRRVEELQALCAPDQAARLAELLDEVPGTTLKDLTTYGVDETDPMRWIADQCLM